MRGLAKKEDWMLVRILAGVNRAPVPSEQARMAQIRAAHDRTIQIRAGQTLASQLRAVQEPGNSAITQFPL